MSVSVAGLEGRNRFFGADEGAAPNGKERWCILRRRCRVKKRKIAPDRSRALAQLACLERVGVNGQVGRVALVGVFGASGDLSPNKKIGPTTFWAKVVGPG